MTQSAKMPIDSFPIAPPIRVKDRRQERRLETFQDARTFVDDVLAARRTATWREMYMRLNDAETEEQAIQAIAALRDLLRIEGLLASPSRSNI